MTMRSMFFRMLTLAPLALVPATAAAQRLELPPANPPAKLWQQVGLTEISVEYTSPAVQGRRIWGTVVPYDRPWTISPDRAVTVRFGKPVSIGEQAVPAGAYQLSAVPGREQWTFVLTPPGPEAAPIRVKARPRACPHRERLTFVFSDASAERASLDLEWEKVHVSLPVDAHTSREVLAEINELDTAWKSYASAARFMLETKKDFDAGLRYANQSLALKEDWYTFWIKAALLAAKHDYKAALEQGEHAYQLGQQLGDGFVLEPDLRKALSDWKKKI